MEKNGLSKVSRTNAPDKDIRNSPDPDIRGSYYAMQIAKLKTKTTRLRMSKSEEI